jgi:uncharacterized protein YndB with AHSA1/START domain
MPEVHRRHALIEAPLESVWEVVTDPTTHPDWWPEVKDVRVDLVAGQKLQEGSEYVRVVRRMGFLDMVDAVWKVERMEHLKECHFSCKATGTYTRFAFTPAQQDTFVEIEAGMDLAKIEAGMDPLDLQARLFKASTPLWMGRWLRDLLDALPEAVDKSTAGSRT